jgi:two-component system, sensor histidine kinase and response regulator
MPKTLKKQGAGVGRRKSRAGKNGDDWRKGPHRAKKTDVQIQELKRQLNAALQQQTATVQTLRAVIDSSFDLQAVLDKLVETAMQLCDADSANIWRPEGDVLTLAASCGHSSEFKKFAKQNPIKRGRETITGRVFLDSKTINVVDVLADAQFAGLGYQSRGQYRTHLGVPLLKDGKAIGAFALTRSKIRPYSKREIELAENFASQAVLALENARLIFNLRERADELARTAEEMRALEEVSQTINSSIELDIVLSTIVTKAVQLSGTDAGTIYVYDEAGSKFEMRATYGLDQDTIRALERHGIGLDEPHIAQAFAQPDPIQITDLRNSPPTAANKIILEAGYRALLISPLSRIGNRIGFLVIRRRAAGAFSPNTIRLIKTLSAQSALPVRNAQLFRNLERRTSELAKDNAQRKEVEQALRENEAYTRLLFQESHRAMVVYDPEKGFIDCNQAAVEIYGYSSRHEVLGKMPLDFSAPTQYDGTDSLTASRRRDLSALDHGIETFEWRHQRPNGEIWDAITHLMAFNYRGRRLLQFTVEDVTERRKIEEALRANRQLLENVLENSPAVIYAKTKDGHYTYINHEWEVVCGFTREQVIGKTDFDLFPQTIAEQFHSNDSAAMAAGMVLQSEERVNTAAGEQVFLSKKVPLTSKSGEVDGLCGISANITEIRRSESALREAKTLAENATKSKSEFLANMSHEIRTPLNAIIGLSHLSLSSGLSVRQRDYVSKIHSAGVSLLELINSILDFSKVEAGKLEIELSKFKLDTVLENVLTLVGQKAHEKGLELLFDVSPEIPPLLRGDPLRLGQVLTNLLSNAVKFTDKGEVRLRARVEEQAGERVRLGFTVVDTGIGMTEEVARRLFQPFAQADSSTTRKYGGTGLGLTISKRLVELMDGNIEVESRPGEGSTFSFDVLLEIADRNAPRHVVPGRLGDLKVLVVDDNTTARKILENLLRGLGAEVLQAASGPEAVQAVKGADNERQFDLVLLDWQMPGMDGIDAAQHIQSLSALKSKPDIVIITAFGGAEVRVKAERAGLKHVLIKPVTASTLMDTLVELFIPEHRNLITVEKIPPTYDLTGLRVLLAEDNKINQQIAVELLELVGASVEVAGSGQEVLEKLSTNSAEADFDVVLMDLQMPEMDGYQATAKIRAIPHLSELPIIALTAHAFSEERDRCLAAGMRGHISKPIEPEILYQTLLEYRQHHANTNQANHRAAISHEGVAAPEVEGIDTNDGLRRIGGNVRLYRALLKQFAEEGLVVELQSALTGEDYATAARLAHTVKGIAGNIGAKALSELAERLEQCIQSRDAVAINKQAGLLSAERQRIAGSIRANAARTAEATPAAPAPSVDLAPLIRRLRQMLETDDGQSLDYLLEIRDRLGGAIAAVDLDVLQGFVAQYEFAPALNCLAQLADRNNLDLE